MRSLFSSDPWTWSYGFDAPVDFCVWALEQDGLRVPPFDQHAGGDGELRALGMTGDLWLAWLREVVHLQGDDDARRDWAMHVRAAAANPMAAHPPIPPFLDPPVACPGPEALRERLGILWRGPRDPANPAKRLCLQGYPGVLNQRKTVDLPSPEPMYGVEWQLWRDLQPYHARMSRLRILVVAYVAFAHVVVSPDAAVLALTASFADAAAFRDAILACAQAVADAE